jgi:D-alanine-D-alanine ligase
MARRRVVVLFGGRSSEHEISCLSARSVIDALDGNDVEVVPIGIARDGRWYVLPGPPALPAETGRMPEVVADATALARLAGDDGTPALVLADGSRSAVDVVFPVLHGPRGEDGAIQGLLEVAGVPYVGAGVLGSALGMDKAMQKALWAAADLPVVPHVVVTEPEWTDDADGVLARATGLGLPLFTKPASLGSSVGITKVASLEELPAAIATALRFERKIVIERGIDPVREIECAVLGNDDPKASIPGEIIPSHEFYSYAAKYLDEDGARLEIPAKLDAATVKRVQELAVKTFKALDCEGMGRVDFFLTKDGALYVNEINTIPGFTKISMYPKLWEASGIGYSALISRLIELAIERFKHEQTLATSYED